MPTGQAFIVVDRAGENTIIVATPGANSSVDTLGPADDEVLSGLKVLLIQLELPQPWSPGSGHPRNIRFPW
jgi:sugar/nucleoside kinase (ribokinase family)